jgi:kinesin family member 5
MSGETIRVCCRFRPQNSRENAEEAKQKTLSEPAVQLGDDGKSVSVANVRRGNDKVTFNLDRIFAGAEISQPQVYDYVARQTIEDVLEGYNGTVLAYGQTSSGKTFTMFGADVFEPALAGVIPRSASHIFEYVAANRDGRVVTLKCSFLEIYKEQVRDLLNPSGANLKVRETPSRGVWVDGLSEHYVQSEQDVLDLIKLGEQYRQVTATDMNQVSSRSHSLFIVVVEQRMPDGSTRTGRLNLADLAGSEKVGKTNARGNTLEEAKKINQSLSALGNCMAALTKQQRHVPYRDSKLSFILRESLGGNTKTTLVVCCSPHRFNVDETLSTLRFAQRAKTIKNKAVVNRKRSVEELEAIVKKLAEQIESMRRYIAALERALKQHAPAVDLAALRKKAALGGGGKSSSPSSPSSSSSNASSSSSSSNDSPPPSPAMQRAMAHGEAAAEWQVKYERFKADADAEMQQLREELASLQAGKDDAERRAKELDARSAQHDERLGELEVAMRAVEDARNKARYDFEQQALALRAADERVAKLSARNEQLEQQLTERADVAERRAAEQAAREERDRLDSELTAARARLTRLDAERDALAARADSAERERRALSADAKRLAADNERLAAQLDGYEKAREQLLDARKQLVDARARAESAERALAESAARAAELDVQLKASASEARDERDKRTKAQRAMAAGDKQRKAAEQRAADAEQRAADAERCAAESGTKATRANEQVSRLTAERAKHAEQRAAARKRIAELQQQAEQRAAAEKRRQADADAARADADSLRGARDTARADAEELRGRVRALDADIDALTRQLDELRRAADERAAAAESLRADKQRAVDARDEALRERDEARARLDALATDESALHERAVALDSRASGAERGRDELGEQLAASRAELDEARARADDAQHRVDEAERLRADAEARIDEARRASSGADEASAELRRQLEAGAEARADIEARLCTAEAERDAAQARRQEESVRADALDVELDEMRARIEALEAHSVADADEARARSEEHARTLDAELKRVRVEADARRAEADEALAEAVDERDALRAQRDVLEGRAERVEAERAELRALVESAQSERDKTALELAERAERAKSEGGELERLRAEAASANEAARAEHDALRAKLADVERAAADAESARDVAAQRADKAARDVEELRKRGAGLEDRLASAELDAQSTHAKLDLLHSMASVGDEQCDRQRVRIEELEAESKRVRDERNELRERFDLIQRAYPELEAKLEEQRRIFLEMAGMNLNATRIVAPVRHSRLKALFSSPAKKAQLPKRASIREDAVLCKGYLNKEGGFVKSWRRRYFILRGASVLYFKDAGVDNALGAIPITGDSQVRPAEADCKRKNSFGIYHPSERTYYMQASSVEERDQWINAIYGVLQPVSGASISGSASGLAVERNDAPLRDTQ